MESAAIPAVGQPAPAHTATEVLASAPGSTARDKIGTAGLRSLRTLLQGVAGAFPAAGAGTAIVAATYWDAFAFAVLAAVIAAFVSFLQNIASFLPADPTQPS